MKARALRMQPSPLIVPMPSAPSVEGVLGEMGMVIALAGCGAITGAATAPCVGRRVKVRGKDGWVNTHTHTQKKKTRGNACDKP